MLLSLYFHNPILAPKTQKKGTFSNSTSLFPPKLFKTFPNPHPMLHHPTFPFPNPTPNPLQNPKPKPPQLPNSAIENLKSLGIVEEKDKTLNLVFETGDKDSAGEIFVPLPNRISHFWVGHNINTSWSTPENPVPQPGSGGVMVRYNELRSEVKRQKRVEGKRKERKEVPNLAELMLSRKELRRLSESLLQYPKTVKGEKSATHPTIPFFELQTNNYRVFPESLCLPTL